MTVTIYNQHENGILIPRKRTRNRTKYIEKAVETLENTCSNCNNCKQAILLPNGVYCGKLRERAPNVSNCPHFNLEPTEYKLYRRI